jgi:cell division protein FtsL
MTQLTDTFVLRSQPVRNSTRHREGASRQGWAYLLCLSLGVISLFILNLCQGARIVGSQHRLSQLKASKGDLEKEQSNLRLRVQKLSSLERIEKVAVEHLGMQQPRGREVLDLSPVDRKTAAMRMEIASGRFASSMLR